MKLNQLLCQKVGNPMKASLYTTPARVSKRCHHNTSLPQPTVQHSLRQRNHESRVPDQISNSTPHPPNPALLAQSTQRAQHARHFALFPPMGEDNPRVEEVSQRLEDIPQSLRTRPSQAVVVGLRAVNGVHAAVELVRDPERPCDRTACEGMRSAQDVDCVPDD